MITPTVHLSHETSQGSSTDDRIPGRRESTESVRTYVEDRRLLFFGAGSMVLAAVILAI